MAHSTTYGYELWRDDSLNLSAAFDTEAEALTAIRQEIREHGTAIVLHSVLVCASTRGVRTVIAEGQALVDRAMKGN